MFRNIFPMVVLVSVVACAPGSGSARGASRTGTITRADIAEISAVSAYDVVEKLRRNWLDSRGPISLSDPSPAYPTVYVDGFEYGPLYVLRVIAVSGVEEITFQSTLESNLRYGPGHFGGIIHVTMRH